MVYQWRAAGDTPPTTSQCSVDTENIFVSSTAGKGEYGMDI